MKKQYWIILLVIFATATNCSKRTVDGEVVKDLQKQYASLAVIQKSIENEHAQLFAEKDTLITQLRLVKGALDPNVENLNDKYRAFLEQQHALSIQHNNILGALAQLQDEVANGDISEGDALREKNELLEQQKAVIENYKSFIKTKERLLNEYKELNQGQSLTMQ